MATPTALFVQYTDPGAYPPTERAANILRDAGWRVILLGIQLPGDVSKLKVASRSGILLRLLKYGGLSRGPLRYLMFLLMTLSNVLRERPRLVYCSDLMSYPAGLLVSLVTRAKIVMHEHDTPGLGGGVAGWLMWCRRTFARRADLCVIPQEERAQRFAAETGADKVLVAFNCPSRSEILPLAPKGPSAGLTLWHHGSLGPGRLPLTLLSALERLPPDVRLTFAGYETVTTKNFVRDYLRDAADRGLVERVTYLGALPLRKDLYAAASRADVGVCLFANEFIEPMAGASNKPFDFLACGLPLLCNATEEWKSFFGRTGVALNCDPDDPQDIVRAVQWFVDHPRERAKMSAEGLRLLHEEWNYEVQFGRVMGTLGL